MAKGVRAQLTAIGKICTRCDLDLSLDQFYSLAAGLGGRTAYCKRCVKKTSSESRRRRPLGREIIQSRTYGVSVEWILAEQIRLNNLCALCRTRPIQCIDHDHKTGKVRGMLCSTCNKAIGMLGDGVAGLEAALAYLQG